jgi:hypothetical protein
MYYQVQHLTFPIQRFWDHRGGDRMIVGFTTTCVISAYHHKRCEFEPSSWRGVDHHHDDPRIVVLEMLNAELGNTCIIIIDYSPILCIYFQAIY